MCRVEATVPSSQTEEAGRPWLIRQAAIDPRLQRSANVRLMPLVEPVKDIQCFPACSVVDGFGFLEKQAAILSAVRSREGSWASYGGNELETEGMGNKNESQSKARRFGSENPSLHRFCHRSCLLEDSIFFLLSLRYSHSVSRIYISAVGLAMSP